MVEATRALLAGGTSCVVWGTSCGRGGAQLTLGVVGTLGQLVGRRSCHQKHDRFAWAAGERQGDAAAVHAAPGGVSATPGPMPRPTTTLQGGKRKKYYHCNLR